MADKAGTGVGQRAQSGGSMAESHFDGLEPGVDFKPYLRFKFHKCMQSTSTKIRLIVAVYPLSFDTQTFEQLGLKI